MMSLAKKHFLMQQVKENRKSKNGGNSVKNGFFFWYHKRISHGLRRQRTQKVLAREVCMWSLRPVIICALDTL